MGCLLTKRWIYVDNTSNSYAKNYPGIRLWVGGEYPYDSKGCMVFEGEDRRVRIEKNSNIRVWSSPGDKEADGEWMLVETYPKNTKAIIVDKIKNLESSLSPV